MRLIRAACIYLCIIFYAVEWKRENVKMLKNKASEEGKVQVTIERASHSYQCLAMGRIIGVLTPSDYCIGLQGYRLSHHYSSCLIGIGSPLIHQHILDNILM